MIRLLRVELVRLLSRRAIVVIAAVCVIATLVIGVVTTLNTGPPSDGDIAEATAQLEQDRANYDYERDVERCLTKPQRWGVEKDLSEARTERQCRRNIEPRIGWYLWSQPLDLAEQRDDGSGIAVTMLLAIAMMLAGATFVGHDWASGSVSNQLLFEPRRIRIWLAKGIVLAGSAFLLSAAVLTSYWVGLRIVASSRHEPVPPGQFLDCLQMGWRAAGLAAGVALLGFALTMLFRSTVATLGVLLGVAVAGGTLLAVLGIDPVWNPGYNALAIVGDGTTYYGEIPCAEGALAGEICEGQLHLSLTHGLLYLGVVVMVCCVVSLLSFRRRDVP